MPTLASATPSNTPTCKWPRQFMLDYVKQAGWSVRDDAVVAYPYPERTLEATWTDRIPNELVFFGRLSSEKVSTSSPTRSMTCPTRCR